MDSSATDDSRTRRVIKRYQNRKLYDTRESRYVTLPQIAEMIRGGDDVQIIDNTSKEDLTSVTLAQIIYEQEKAAKQRLPTALREFLHTGSERLLASIREGRRLILRDEEEGALAEGQTTEEPASEERPSGLSSLVEASRETLEDWQKKLDERVRTTLSAWKPFLQMQGEVRRLAQRIEQLEAQLTRGAKRPGSGDGGGKAE